MNVNIKNREMRNLITIVVLVFGMITTTHGQLKKGAKIRTEPNAISEIIVETKSEMNLDTVRVGNSAYLQVNYKGQVGYVNEIWFVTEPKKITYKSYTNSSQSINGETVLIRSMQRQIKQYQNSLKIEDNPKIRRIYTNAIKNLRIQIEDERDLIRSGFYNY